MQTRYLMSGTVDQAYFRELGTRIAEFRKLRGITQYQLADAFGFSQQQIQAFEKGRRRIPVSLLPELANLLGVSFEELLGTEKPKTKRGPTSRLERQFELVSSLPPRKQKLVSEMLDAILLQAQQATSG